MKYTMPFIFIVLLPIFIVLALFNYRLFCFLSGEDEVVTKFFYLIILMCFVCFIIYLIFTALILRQKYLKKYEYDMFCCSLLFYMLVFVCVAVADAISRNDDPRLSIQPIKFNTKDMVVYSDEVIKFCNPNLTNSEIQIIKDEITFFEYLPIFLKFQEHKNALSEKQRKTDIKAYKKAERAEKRAKKQAEKAEKERKQQIKKDFLSQKCKGAEKC